MSTPLLHAGRPRGRRPSLVDLNAGFVLAGMATTLLGPIVPVLSRRWNLGDATVATLFTTQFFCSTAITLLSSSMVVRFDATRVLTSGFALIAAGALALGLTPWPLTLLATVTYGCGLGLVLPTTNFVVARANPGREATAVSLVNVSWSAGAVAWPVMVGSLASQQSVALPLGVLAALCAAIAVRLLSSGVADPPPHPGSVAAAVTSVAREQSDPSFPLLAAFAGLLMLYSGSEAAIGGWAAEHVRRLGSARWAIAPTCFWAAVAIGRLTTPVLLGRFAERRVLVVALSAAVTGAAALAGAPRPSVAFVAAVVAGFGLAPVFPITFGALTRDVAPARPRLVGPLYACTGVGSAALPWLVGAASTLAGSLRVGLAIPMAGSVVLLALSVYRTGRRRFVVGSW